MTQGISTTIDVEKYTSVCLQVLEVAKAGREEMQRKEAEKKRRQEAEANAWQAQVDEAWAPRVAAAKGVLPEWMHDYLRWDNSCMPSDWLTLDLPECLPIAIQPDLLPGRIFRNNSLFVVPKVFSWRDEDGEWQVCTDVEYGTSSDYPTLEIAVAYAHERYGQYLEVSDRAEQRNAEAHAAAEAAKAAPTPAAAPATVEIPMDPAANVLAAIAELNLDLDTIFERGLLYGFITLAAELRAVRTAVEDIAAVMVANDPKNQETQL